MHAYLLTGLSTRLPLRKVTLLPAKTYGTLPASQEALLNLCTVQTRETVEAALGMLLVGSKPPS